MTDNLYTDPFADGEGDVAESADTERYRITARGLHEAGAIDDWALSVMQFVEENHKQLQALVTEYDEIIAFLMQELTAVTEELLMDSYSDALVIAQRALAGVTQESADD